MKEWNSVSSETVQSDKGKSKLPSPQGKAQAWQGVGRKMVLGWRKKGGELGSLLPPEDTEAAHMKTFS